MPSKDEPQCKDDGCQHEKENLMLRGKVRILERTNSLFQEKIEKVMVCSLHINKPNDFSIHIKSTTIAAN